MNTFKKRTAAQQNALEHRSKDGRFASFDRPESTQVLRPLGGGTAAVSTLYMDGAKAALNSIPGWAECESVYEKDRLELNAGLGTGFQRVNFERVRSWCPDTTTALAVASCIDAGEDESAVRSILSENGRTWLEDNAELFIASVTSQKDLGASDQVAQAKLQGHLEAELKSRDGGLSGRFSMSIEAYAPHVKDRDVYNLVIAAKEGHITHVDAPELARLLVRDSAWGEMLKRTQETFDNTIRGRIKGDEGEQYWQGVEGDLSSMTYKEKGASIRRFISAGQKEGWLPNSREVKISSRKDGFEVGVVQGRALYPRSDRGYKAVKATKNLDAIRERVRYIRMLHGHNRSEAMYDYFDSEYAHYGSVRELDSDLHSWGE